MCRGEMVEGMNKRTVGLEGGELFSGGGRRWRCCRRGRRMGGEGEERGERRGGYILM